MLKKFAAVFGLLSSVLWGTAFAAMWPDSGWYWNPSESGRGVAIEVQDDKLFVSIFTYEANGAPTFYFSAGQMSGDRNFSAGLFRASNGQCLGCSYRSPGVTQVGTISISFPNPEQATVTALGTTMSLQRYDFSDTNLYNPAALYGEWSTTEGDPLVPTYFGDRILFNAPYTGSDGNLYGRGNRTGASSRLSLGRCQNRGLCVAVLSFSTSSDEYYTFSMSGFNRMEGLLQIVPAGGSPTAGAGFYFVAHRTRTGAFVRTGNGPAISKGLVDDRNLDDLAAAKSRYASAAPKASFEQSFSNEAAQRLMQEVAAEFQALKERAASSP